VTELQEFALDPLAPPAGFLGGKPLDDRGDLALTGGLPVRLG
jgi:hypothetical protein